MPLTTKEDKHAYDDKLGVGTYLGKEIYQTVVALGGMLAGAWAGLVVGARWFPHAIGLDAAKALVDGKKVAGTPAKMMREAEDLVKNQKLWESVGLHKIPGLKTIPTMPGSYVGFAGWFLGSVVAGLVLGYGHWKKEKQAQLQVDEITKDISDIEVFKKTDPELKKENTRLWAMLREREARGGKSHASWREHAQEASVPAERNV